MTLAPRVPSNWPKNWSLILVRRPLKFVWLNALNMSVRSWNFTRSVIEKFFASVKSRFQAPGARTNPFPALPGRTVAREVWFTATGGEGAPVEILKGFFVLAVHDPPADIIGAAGRDGRALRDVHRLSGTGQEDARHLPPAEHVARHGAAHVRKPRQLVEPLADEVVGDVAGRRAAIAPRIEEILNHIAI